MFRAQALRFRFHGPGLLRFLGFVSLSAWDWDASKHLKCPKDPMIKYWVLG